MTYKEFFDLPDEKKREGWEQLSEHDRLIVRCTESCLGYSTDIPCNTCKHRNGILPSCTAFPDGIDGDTLGRKIEDPYGECNNGIYYEKREE